MTVLSAPRVFRSREAALAFITARGLNPATHTITLVREVGYIVRSVGLDPALITGRAA